MHGEGITNVVFKLNWRRGEIGTKPFRPPDYPGAP